MKVYRSINFSNHLITTIATIKDVMKPTARADHSEDEKFMLVFERSKSVAASMVGIASIKENSTAALRGKPTNIPPTIVAAARETPGTIEIA